MKSRLCLRSVQLIQKRRQGFSRVRRAIRSRTSRKHLPARAFLRYAEMNPASRAFTADGLRNQPCRWISSIITNA